MSVFGRHTLDNGLRVLTADMPSVQSVTASQSVRQAVAPAGQV